MIAWLAPGALWMLVAIAGPIAVHLLSRRAPAPQPFPSLRFVTMSRTSAARLHLPADAALLLVRILVVACAAAAVARPLVLTDRRVASWDRRVARAVVLDADSMRASGQPAVAAAAERESRSADFSRLLEAKDLDGGVRAGAAWLMDAPPARRELVIVSGFTLGALDLERLRALPAHVGVRFVPLEGGRRPTRFPGMRLLGGAQEVVLDGAATSVRVTRGSAPGEEEAGAGLRFIVNRRDGAAAERVLEVVRDAGAPAPSLSEPLALVFAGGGEIDSLAPIRGGWMLATAMRLREDRELATLVAPVESQADDGPWLVAFADGSGRPAVRLAARRSELVVHVAAAPASLLAAAAVRAALHARAGADRPFEGREILRIPDAALRRAARDAAPVSRDQARFAQASDARWLWLAALVLLVVEWRVRRTPSGAQPEEASLSRARASSEETPRA